MNQIKQRIWLEKYPFIQSSFRSLDLTQYKITSQAFDFCAQSELAIIGTNKGEIVIISSQTQTFAVHRLIEKPILKIKTGDENGFIISDGSAYFFVDYENFKCQVLQFNTVILDCCFSPGECISYCTGSGCYQKSIKLVLQQTGEKLKNFFQKQQEVGNLFKRDIKFVNYLSQYLVVFTEKSNNICAYSFIQKTFIKWTIYDFQGNIATRESESLFPVCDCCRPIVEYCKGFVMISQHNISQIWHLDQQLGRLNDQYWKYRNLYDVSGNSAMLIYSQHLPDKCLATSFFVDNMVVSISEMIDGARFSVHSILGKLVYEHRIEQKCIALATHPCCNRLFRQIVGSSFSLASNNIFVITEVGILNLSLQTQFDSIIKEFNSFFEQNFQKSLGQSVINQRIDNLLQTLIQSQIEQADVTNMLELLTQLLLSKFMMEEASKTLNLLTSKANFKQQFALITQFLPTFASYGGINYLIPVIPAPTSNQAFQMDVYQQIINSLLINDYETLNRIVQQWVTVYDKNELIRQIKQTLIIANGTGKTDPKFLKDTLVYLYQQTDQFAEALPYIYSVYSFNEIISYVEEHKLYQDLMHNDLILQQLDTEKIVQMLQNTNGVQVFGQILASFLKTKVYESVKVDEMFEQYLLINYTQDKLISIDLSLLRQDKQLKQIFDLLQIIYQKAIELQNQNLHAIISNYYYIYFKLLPVYEQNQGQLLILFVRFLSLTVTIHLSQDKQYRDSKTYTIFLSRIIDFVPEAKCSQINLNVQFAHNDLSQECLLKKSTYRGYLQRDIPILNILFNYIIDFQQTLQEGKQLQYDLNKIAKQYETFPYSPVVVVLNTLESVSYPLQESHVQTAFLYSSQISQTITILSRTLRNLIPLDQLTKVDIARSTLGDLKIDRDFRRACAEALCEDLYQSFLTRQLIYSGGYLCLMKNCSLCNQQLADDIILLGCGHQMHVRCMTKITKRLGTPEQLPICPICFDGPKLQAFISNPFQWFDILD